MTSGTEQNNIDPCSMNRKSGQGCRQINRPFQLSAGSSGEGNPMEMLSQDIKPDQGPQQFLTEGKLLSGSLFTLASRGYPDGREL